MKRIVSIVRIGLWIAASLCVIAVLSGCGAEKRTDKRVIVFGADNSGSLNTEMVKRYSGILETIVDKQKGYARVRIFQFASGTDASGRKIKPASLYNDRPRTSQGVWGTVDRHLVGGVISTDKGTDYAPMIREIKELAAEMPDKPFFGVLLSDGGATDLEEARKAAAELASVPNFKMLLVSPVLSGKIRTDLESVLEPLGDKVMIRSWEDLEGGLKAFIEQTREEN